MSDRSNRRGRIGRRLRDLREWVMDGTHRWRRWAALVITVTLAWILCAAVTQPAPAPIPGREDTAGAATAGADADEPADAGEDADGETNGQAADRVSKAMNDLLASRPADADALGDVVEPGGVPLSEDLDTAEQDVTDLLKQAYADPNARTVADDLDGAYDTWQAMVWQVACNYKLRTATGTLMNMGDTITRIEDMATRPPECDTMIDVAHTLPESGEDSDAYTRAQRWIVDFNDAYASCSAALGEAGQ